MKIVFLTEFFPSDDQPVFTGGVEARVFHLSHHLRKKHQVVVKRLTDRYSFNTWEAIFQRAFFFLGYLLKLLFSPEKANLVEGTNFTTYFLAFAHARRIGAKAVAWWPDVFVGQSINRLGLISGLVVEITERIALKLPWDGVIALSEETKRKLVAAGVRCKNIEVIYGGAVVRPACRRGRGSSAPKYQRPTILCISRLVKYKRVEDAVLAVYLLEESIPNIRLLIVGEGPRRPSLQLQSTSYKLPANIKFLGRVSEEKKWELLARSHVHVLPSIVEGFGLVTIEALTAGTPAVNADILINREILNGSQGGLLYSPGDYLDLAEKIELLLQDKKLYNQKVREGKKLIRQYDWEKINQQTENFYQRLLSN